MQTDPIADMLARIRNAIAVHKSEVVVPYSKLREAVARLLADNNFIDQVNVADAEIGKNLVLTLNAPDQNARITEIVRLSTPGRRLYASARNIPVVKQGRGLVIVSTSKGLMTDQKARTERIGGELICKVY